MAGLMIAKVFVDRLKMQIFLETKQICLHEHVMVGLSRDFCVCFVTTLCVFLVSILVALSSQERNLTVSHDDEASENRDEKSLIVRSLVRRMVAGLADQSVSEYENELNISFVAAAVGALTVGKDTDKSHILFAEGALMKALLGEELQFRVDRASRRITNALTTALRGEWVTPASKGLLARHLLGTALTVVKDRLVTPSYLFEIATAAIDLIKGHPSFPNHDTQTDEYLFEIRSRMHNELSFVLKELAPVYASIMNVQYYFSNEMWGWLIRDIELRLNDTHPEWEETSLDVIEAFIIAIGDSHRREHVDFVQLLEKIIAVNGTFPLTLRKLEMFRHTCRSLNRIASRIMTERKILEGCMKMKE